MNYEAWIWTELLAFDNTQKDQGVSEYLIKTGFIPKGICLLVSSPDFVLLHDGIKEEKILPPDICSRRGHERNEERERQEWTNYQIKSLVENLHKKGVEVYISMFTSYMMDKFHGEWMSKHPEVMQEWDFQGRSPCVNCLRRLKDGRYFEDIFIAKVIEASNDYGFDGWHGPDGYGPLSSGALPYTDCSDDMMGQFAAYYKKPLPDIVTCDSIIRIPTVRTLQDRMNWLWSNLRKEWIDFNVTRWETFWKKMVDALHKNGKKALINSAWTRACFEAMYRYGIDYRRITNTGVDYMVVETVAEGLSLINESIKRNLHHDFLAMLMEIKAFAPDMKLLFLHGVKDVVEEFNLLSHAPTSLERDCYSLANIYYQDKEKLPRRAVDGLLVCLGDGITSEEWEWLKTRWDLSFAAKSRKSGELTFVWSDNAFYELLDDYIRNGTWSSHLTAFHLMERGIQIQTGARIENVEFLKGPLLIPCSHLLPDSELKNILAYENGPLILIGNLEAEQIPSNSVFIKCGDMACAIINSSMKRQSVIIPYFSGKFIEEKVPLSFKEDISWCEVLELFWVSASEFISSAIEEYNSEKGLTSCTCISENNKVTLMSSQIDEHKIHLAVKNTDRHYLKREISITKKPDKIKIQGKYPATELACNNNKFSVRIPPHGIIILEISI
ncbi:MAG: hypothetical protein UT30_C0008G0028 [Candidatus Uhrbacteria bacterium GW2011_GWF2_39_13]|uniref:Beta-galactosidase trimerisation domain-containing protein n=1 Tax=Candidatus Uhrbacteria bacterium GW2011_GWF2_39_13 TaxID=1618995 RepID=A0A0G0MVD6_9BACT|nr:MAG: hypothetical protein UT30_C0008G0028 [Candidatus Uhrbacteria bacterium GW2011_GWF2_39_13]